MYWRPLLLPLVLPQLVWLLLVSNPNPTSGHCCGPSSSSLSSTTQNTGKAAAAEDRRLRWQQQQRQQQQQQQPPPPPQITTPPPVLLFHGTLLNEFFEPLSNALVQFWHADIYGNYAHPGNDFQQEGPEHLVTEIFSYFGTATTDTTGHFAFRTYRPGIYASRPITHIHYKVFSNTTTATTTTTTNTTNHPQQQQQQPTLLLTSQFYFDDENFNGILAGRGYDDRQILQLKEEREDEEDHSGLVLTTTKTIVVAAMAQTSLTERGEQYPTHAATTKTNTTTTTTKNTLPLTPWDVEGPFYPVVDFWEVGNDMTSGILDTHRKYIPPASSVPVPGPVPIHDAACCRHHHYDVVFIILVIPTFGGVFDLLFLI